MLELLLEPHSSQFVAIFKVQVLDLVVVDQLFTCLLPEERARRVDEKHHVVNINTVAIVF